MRSQRLQKVLAQAGIASRRAAERLITEGRVRVNGRIVTELGARANPDRDRVEVDGRRLVAQRHVYFLMHKPRGVVTTLDDPEGRKTVKDLLRGIHERVFPVGRLDFQTSGALLLTNDGELAQALLHPTRAVPKTYNAKLQGELDEARLTQLRSGVVLDDGQKTAPAEVSILRKDEKATSIEITIAEGKNRQIHRMGEAIARTVLRLTRISFAGLTLEGLRAGQLRPLKPTEISDLKETYLHRAKRKRPFRAYDETGLEESHDLFAVDDGPEDDGTADAHDDQPPHATARSGPGRAPAAREHRKDRPTHFQRADDQATRGNRRPRFMRNASDDQTTQGNRGSRIKRGASDDQTTSVGRGARFKRGPADPRSKRHRAEQDESPRKHSAARTQPSKRTRSQPSKAKRAGAPRKTSFKR